MEPRFILLFQKYVTRTGSPSDTETFWLMIKDSKYNDLLIKLIDEHYTSFEDIDDTLKSEVEDRILGRIFSSQGHNIVIDPPTFPLYRKWSRWVAAAAIATLIVSAGIWSLKRGDSARHSTSVVANDVPPGKVGATLTLANGKKIKLTDVANGEIAREAGISVRKTTDGQLVYEVNESKGDLKQINTLSTQKGETFMITLPDESKVWLNAASSLTYAARLNENGERRVKLMGEAFFQVTKDKNSPFIVETNGQQVEVLGTHFNVNSYADEPGVATTLVEGSVKVIALVSGIKHSQIIKPGQQALNVGGHISVSKANLQNITDWKDGEFYLDHLDFKTAMRKVARWYNMEIVYDQNFPDDLEAGGWVPRDTKLSILLQSIEKLGMAKFKIEGRRIYVSR